ncbi:hypothetical protein HIMB100_00008940 [SAR116 cluster alpha proteobacterium HIMB100]|nr:hypothetical protein HIMB100_00008940 [SAR116 cluster alpha proteobacterium HIMB100]
MQSLRPCFFNFFTAFFYCPGLDIWKSQRLVRLAVSVDKTLATDYNRYQQLCAFQGSRGWLHSFGEPKRRMVITNAFTFQTDDQAECTKNWD